MNKTANPAAAELTTHQQLKDATLLIELSKNLNATLDRDTIIQSLTYILTRKLRTPKMGVFLHTTIDAEAFSLHRNFLGLNTTDDATYSMPSSHPLISYIQGKPGVHAIDALLHHLSLDAELEGLLSLGADYILPTRADNSTNGFILFGTPPPQQTLPSHHLDFLSTAAVIAGIALRNAHLYQVSTTDMMTKLKLRHHFMNALRSAYHDAGTSDPLALIMLDIDHFKSVNDTYGHAAGDVVIKTVAHLMADTARHTDIAARIGGEEFVILLPHSDIEQAHIMAERMRSTIEATTVDTGDHQINITISIGIAQLDHTKDDAPHAFLERADDALYYSKEHGRNQITKA